ncbi:hypothetical protein AB1Y20_009324 [Prymnesium parvum]|uniref:Bestrophin homolog n=1 Tax=Prymnesium parvum TaxID=97485 RepID=A0AB34K3V3_PRYPA
MPAIPRLEISRDAEEAARAHSGQLHFSERCHGEFAIRVKTCRLTGAAISISMAMAALRLVAFGLASVTALSMRPAHLLARNTKVPLRVQCISTAAGWKVGAPRQTDVASTPEVRRYSSQDWLHAMLALKRSVVLKRLTSRLLFNAGIAVFVVVLRARGFAPQLNSLVHSLLGGFLGLLLVFRTNSAYSRFWEGRCLWGALNNHCHNLAVGAVAYLRPIAPSAATAFSDALLEIPYSLTLTCERRGLAETSRLAILMHQALVAASSEAEVTFGNSLSRARLFELQLTQLAELTNNLVDVAGACNRLAKTPVPLSYSRHTSRFLTLWCGTLPFVFAPSMGAASIPAVVLTCYMLFAIEELGHLIEQPFETLGGADPWDHSVPIYSLAANIKQCTKDLLQ